MIVVLVITSNSGGIFRYSIFRLLLRPWTPNFSHCAPCRRMFWFLRAGFSAKFFMNATNELPNLTNACGALMQSARLIPRNRCVELPPLNRFRCVAFSKVKRSLAGAQILAFRLCQIGPGSPFKYMENRSIFAHFGSSGLCVQLHQTRARGARTTSPAPYAAVTLKNL